MWDVVAVMIQYFLGWEPILACFPRVLAKDDNTVVATLWRDPFAELCMKIPGMRITNFHQIIVLCTFNFASTPVCGTTEECAIGQNDLVEVPDNGVMMCRE